jgi:hypothetical protein
MTVLANGCSFIYGSELKDTYGGKHNSQTTYPALLSKKSSKEYICIANPGASNTAISRTTIAGCEEFKPEFVLVQWTFPSRYEFRFAYNTRNKKTPWCDFSAWNLQTTDDIQSSFHNPDDSILEYHLKRQELDRVTGVEKFAKMFYKNIAIDEYWEMYNTLKEIVMLQNYLKVHNIPYLFTGADNCILDNWTISAGTNGKKNNMPDGFDEPAISEHDIKIDYTILGLYNSIDFGAWWWFPKGDNEHETSNPRGFYQWAVENKYKVGTTHPLEEAHAAAAELLQEKFNDSMG